ncbi:MAG: hypothetical protein JST80_05220 [Bdellovibrionales bacterium]|nr:hypothetical protein [Bdellovibrionales bacterium]
MLKRLSAVGGVVWFMFSANAFAQSPVPNDVPRMPDPNMTPGSLCAEGNTYRYPEHIRYCARDVDVYLKEQIFHRYGQKYNNFKNYKRAHFKMDHFIPLCMGGSNNPNNIWPQHQTIYPQTDQIEDLLCIGMSKGLLKQAQAVRMIMQVKRNLAVAPQMRNQLHQMYGRFLGWDGSEP